MAKPRCCIHPGREGAKVLFGKWYCLPCVKGQEAAVQTVRQQNSHVEPKECFLTYDGHRWIPFQGTGCAHWVAHQLNISKGAQWNQCLKGCTIRVPDLVHGKQKLANLKDVRVNDIWTNPELGHTGLVSKIETDASGKMTISITHDSSAQGGVRTNDFNTYFHGQGNFYR
jgi:hypothetical protein